MIVIDFSYINGKLRPFFDTPMKGNCRVFIFSDSFSDGTRGFGIACAETKEEAIDKILKEYDDAAMMEKEKKKLIEQWWKLNSPIILEIDKIFSLSRVRTLGDIEMNSKFMDGSTKEKLENLVRKLDEINSTYEGLLESMMPKTGTFIGNRPPLRDQFETWLRMCKAKEIGQNKDFVLLNIASK